MYAAAALVLLGGGLVVALLTTEFGTGTRDCPRQDGPRQALPLMKTNGGMSLAEALAKRRSIREFAAKSLSREQVAQLCWAAQGVTGGAGKGRTAPSAGALYPLVVFVVDERGLSEYEPASHSLREVLVGDLRPRLQAAAHGQPCVGAAPVCVVIVMDVGRTTTKYGRRAERYCLLEAGHAAQNVLLQATALGLGGVPVGAFEDDKVADVLSLPLNARPVYLIPIGYPTGE